MVDFFMKRERHIVAEISKGSQSLNLRDFGPQSLDDLMIQKDIVRLEKILPVINGLIYQKKENRDILYQNLDSI